MCPATCADTDRAAHRIGCRVNCPHQVGGRRRDRGPTNVRCQEAINTAVKHAIPRDVKVELKCETRADHRWHL